MISYIIPTRNRHERLAQTLDAIDRLYADHPPLARAAEVIVVDNASDPPVTRVRRPHALHTTVVTLDANHAAAARNIAAARARHDWLVMLDDDSHPLDINIHRLTAAAPPRVAAIGAEIILPTGAHEAGGLPEVFIGCGAAIRRDLFNSLGGYDPSFHYYAEEYDLAARIILQGSAIIHHAAWKVVHHKVSTGRDMNAILRNLIRNNLWINRRYTPQPLLTHRSEEIINHYRRIAEREHAIDGFNRGLDEARHTLDAQPRTPMTADLDDRFTGLNAARTALAGALNGVATAALTHQGKNAGQVARALRSLGVSIVNDDERADARVIASLSPGPILDALASAPPGVLVAPYTMPDAQPHGIARAA